MAVLSVKYCYVRMGLRRCEQQKKALGSSEKKTDPLKQLINSW